MSFSSCHWTNGLKNSTWINVSCNRIEHPLIFTFCDGNILEIEYFDDYIEKYNYSFKGNRLFLKKKNVTTEYEVKKVDNMLTIIGMELESFITGDTIYLKNARDFLKTENKLLSDSLFDEKHYWNIDFNNNSERHITNIHFFSNNKHIFEGCQIVDFVYYDYELGDWGLSEKKVEGISHYFLWFTKVSQRKDFIFYLTEIKDNEIKGLLLGNYQLTDSLHLTNVENNQSENFLCQTKWGFDKFAFQSLEIMYNIPLSLSFYCNIFEINDSFFYVKDIFKTFMADYKYHYKNPTDIYKSFFSERLIVLEPPPENIENILQIVSKSEDSLTVRFFTEPRERFVTYKKRK